MILSRKKAINLRNNIRKQLSAHDITTYIDRESYYQRATVFFGDAIKHYFSLEFHFSCRRSQKFTQANVDRSLSLLNRLNDEFALDLQVSDVDLRRVVCVCKNTSTTVIINYVDDFNRRRGQPNLLIVIPRTADSR